MNKNIKKKEIHFISTKYKNQPIKIDFYTQTGMTVPANKVIKEQTKTGIRFFTYE